MFKFLIVVNSAKEAEYVIIGGYDSREEAEQFVRDYRADHGAADEVVIYERA